MVNLQKYFVAHCALFFIIVVTISEGRLVANLRDLNTPVNRFLVTFKDILIDWVDIPLDDDIVDDLVEESIKRYSTYTNLDFVLNEVAGASEYKYRGSTYYNLHFTAHKHDTTDTFKCNAVLNQDYDGSNITPGQINVYCYNKELYNQVRDDDTVSELFEDFKKKYGIIYRMETQEIAHKLTFTQNLNTIELMNAKEKGSAKYGITKFTDLTKNEFIVQHTGRVQTTTRFSLDDADIPDIDVDDMPSDFDWRDEGAVTPIKDQQNCGSCWTFSTAANIESLHQIKTGTLRSLSEQQLVDCDVYDEGCEGGLPETAYRSLIEMGGINFESHYPYVGRTQNYCLFDRDPKHSVKIKGGVILPHDEEDIAKYLYVNGPVSISINAVTMQLYESGVAFPSKSVCDPNDLTHSILLVGYGVTHVKGRKVPYWIAKNSWGENWGEDGYYRIYRGKGVCGLNQHVTSPIL